MDEKINLGEDVTIPAQEISQHFEVDFPHVFNDPDDADVANQLLGLGSVDDAKAKFLKEAKEDALHKTASAYARDQDPYPSPYLNLSDYQLPKSMTEIFKWCRYFYKFDSLIGAAVNTMSRFPVSDILFEEATNMDNGPYNSDDSPTLSFYKDQFDYLDINEFLVKIGIDYWLYGNCFVFGEYEDFSDLKDGTDIRWSKLYRMDPAKMVIEFNPLTQETIYQWLVPDKIIELCKTKKPAKDYAAIPAMIRQAAEKNKPLILNQDNIYHFSREGESGDGSIWGTPLILNVMKQLAYRNLLRQAQEAIAREHIVPMRVYYLTPTNSVDPNATWNKTAADLAGQLQKAAKDPNYKIVSPVPVNKIDVGGQGRALMLTAEIEQLQSEILAGLGVPREFIFGGVSYSAASISLRTLENQFINYRLLLADFMNNFLIKKLATVRGEYRTTADKGNLIIIKMADLKMQDDIQQKQMIINMNATGKVSDDYMYGMLGMDPQKMKVQIEMEVFERMERERRMQLYNLETQFMVQQNQASYQANIVAQQQQLGLMPTAEEGSAAAQEQQQQAADQQAQAADQQAQVAAATPAKAGNSNITIKVDAAGAKTETKKPATKPEKKPEKEKKDAPKSTLKKKADDEDDVYDTIYKQGTEAMVDKIVTAMTKLSSTEVKNFLTGTTPAIRELLTEKLAGLNPQAMSASASRNVALSEMTELEKMDAGKNLIEKSVRDSYAANIDNAMMPHSQLRPERRSTAV